MGLLAIVPVMILTAVFGGIWGVVALATRGAEHAAKVDALLGVSLGVILMVVLITVALVGALGIVAGAGVLLGHMWGDVLATVLSAIHVFNLPFGTALAAYAFWALWVKEPRAGVALATPVREEPLSAM